MLAILLVGCNASSNVSSGRTPAGSPSTFGPQTVTINSSDGVQLVGSYWVSPQQPAPAVLLLHQWQSDRHSFDEFASKLQSRGFYVLAIDGRGFGESTRKADGSTVNSGRSDSDVKAMLGDVSAAVEFLTGRPDIDPNRIAIVGASYGSSLAMLYASRRPEIASVALLSPGVNYFGNMQMVPAVKEYGARPLLMAAANDDPESADAVTELGKAVDGNQRMKVTVLPKGGHGTALLKDGAFTDGLLSFLVETLQRT